MPRILAPHRKVRWQAPDFVTFGMKGLGTINSASFIARELVREQSSHRRKGLDLIFSMP